MQQRIKDLIGKSWYNQLFPYLRSKSFYSMWSKLAMIRKEFKDKLIPTSNSNLLFKAFRTTSYEDTKVIILGQCPYHDILLNGSIRYDGLAFSNKNNSINTPVSPSLKNIIKELRSDIGTKDNPENLYPWAEQGVLLINTANTVIQGNPGVHITLWKEFTLEVIDKLNLKDNIVWILWGNHAKSFKQYITNSTHFIIEGAHPSPYSAKNFFGGKYFSKCNEFLETKDIKPINWLL